MWKWLPKVSDKQTFGATLRFHVPAHLKGDNPSNGTLTGTLSVFSDQIALQSSKNYRIAVVLLDYRAYTCLIMVKTRT